MTAFHTTSAASSRPVVHSSLRDYWQLLKPRIMYLVVFTAVVGMIAAPGSIHPFIGSVSILCVALGSGAAGALNMWYDSDIDAVMTRTKNRPIPSGRIRREQALECGIVLSLLSVFIMAISVNYTSALLLASSIASYVGMYTMLLKRHTRQNIVIGGIAGALPPVIGYTSVAGVPSLESLSLFAIIFMWTPPHFWALSLLNCEEYKRACIPMMSDCIPLTRAYIFGYSILLLLVSTLPGLFIKRALLYEILALSLGAVFLIRATTVFMEKGTPTTERCMGLFTYSIYYLFLLFTAIAVCC